MVHIYENLTPEGEKALGINKEKKAQYQKEITEAEKPTPTIFDDATNYDEYSEIKHNRLKSHLEDEAMMNEFAQNLKGNTHIQELLDNLSKKEGVARKEIRKIKVADTVAKPGATEKEQQKAQNLAVDRTNLKNTIATSKFMDSVFADTHPKEESSQKEPAEEVLDLNKDWDGLKTITNTERRSHAERVAEQNENTNFAKAYASISNKRRKEGAGKKRSNTFEQNQKRNRENDLDKISFNTNNGDLAIEKDSALTSKDAVVYHMMSSALALRDPEYANLREYKIRDIYTITNKKNKEVTLLDVILPDGKKVTVSQEEFARIQESSIAVGPYNIAQGQIVPENITQVINQLGKNKGRNDKAWRFERAFFAKKTGDLLLSFKDTEDQPYTLNAIWVKEGLEKNGVRAKRPRITPEGLFGNGAPKVAKEELFEKQQEKPKPTVTAKELFGKTQEAEAEKPTTPTVTKAGLFGDR